MKLKYFFAVIIAALIWPIRALAHPMPNSILRLDVKSNGIFAELQLPLPELQLAMGKDLSSLADNLIQVYGKELSGYILAHIHPVSENGATWEVKILDLQTGTAEQTATGIYQELTAQLWMQPLQPTNLGKFTLNYDGIVHQVVTHKILVSVRQDWMNGKIGKEQVQVGVIGLEARSNTIPPLTINLEEGNLWKGFKSMVNLGMQHISEGTDHLLFLLALLLSAPLIAEDNRWTKFGGTKYGVMRLIKIATAFTLGHSITLLVGALGGLRLPQQPVEILIAFSILVTAVHALRPLFPNKEIFVAGGFGLVHGLGFATIISNLQLEAGRMALSLLGFNLGIELMQLFVILITMPWLLLIGNLAIYKWSNLPCGSNCRNGIQFGTLTSAQLAAAKTVIQAAAGTAVSEGYTEFMQIVTADSLLGTTAGSNYSKGIYFISFLNNPSTTGAWMLQYGGHHVAVNIAFNKGQVIGATPIFEGVEPISWTNGLASGPLANEHSAMTAMLASLTSAQLSTARLSSTFSDVVLGPNQDGNFPTTKVGLVCSALTSAQQALVLAAMDPWLNDVDAATAATLRAIYQSELSGTYIAYTGSGTSGSASSFLNANTNYVRLDGPSVWIEFVCQSGVVFPAQIHYHTVWRDHTRDYGNYLSTSVAERSGDLPMQFSLGQNYPNPFWSGATSRSAGNPSTTISFRLAAKEFVSVKVFDLYGREVATVVSEELAAGTYARQWNAAGVTSGVYFYRLQAGSFSETKKLTLLR